MWKKNSTVRWLIQVCWWVCRWDRDHGSRRWYRCRNTSLDMTRYSNNRRDLGRPRPLHLTIRQRTPTSLCSNTISSLIVIKKFVISRGENARRCVILSNILTYKTATVGQCQVTVYKLFTFYTHCWRHVGLSMRLRNVGYWHSVSMRLG